MEESIPKPSKPKTHATERIVSGSIPFGLFKLGIPLALAMAFTSLFNLIDMLVVSGLPDGKEAVAALAICDLVAMVPTILANGISNASAAVISRRAGEEDTESVSFFTWQSLSLVFWIAVIFGVIGVFWSDAITTHVFGAKGHMRELAIAYMEIIVGGCFSILLLLQMIAIMRALGNSRMPLILLVGSNILNLFVTIVMVWGNSSEAPEMLAWVQPIGEFFGLEPMGVVGAAWSTIASRSVALLIGAIVLASGHHLVKFRLRYLKLTQKAARQILSLAWPNSAQFVLRIFVILFFMAVITRHFTSELDSSTATAFGICTRFENLILFVSMGWGAASSTFIGQNLGARQASRAIASGWWGSLYNFIFIVIILLLVMFYSAEMIGFFNNDPEVIRVGQSYLKIVGASYLLFGLAVVLSQALTGAGVTMVGFTMDAAILVGIVVPVSLIVIQSTELTETTTWFLIAGGNVLSGLAYALYYQLKRKKWTAKLV